MFSSDEIFSQISLEKGSFTSLFITEFYFYEGQVQFAPLGRNTTKTVSFSVFSSAQYNCSNVNVPFVTFLCTEKCS